MTETEPMIRLEPVSAHLEPFGAHLDKAGGKVASGARALPNLASDEHCSDHSGDSLYRYDSTVFPLWLPSK